MDLTVRQKSPVSGFPDKSNRTSGGKRRDAGSEPWNCKSMSNDKQGMDDIKIPTFLTNKKQED